MFIFVYGSLKKNFKYHYLIEHLNFIGEAKTLDKLEMKRYKDYEFPYILNKATEIISGELYELSKKDLLDIDYLEGYPSFYSRKEIYVISNNIKYKAFIYYIKKEFKTKNKNINEWTLDMEIS